MTHDKIPQSELIDPQRRRLLRSGFYGLGLLAAGPLLTACQSRQDTVPQSDTGLANVGPLGAPDSNGLRLPAGFTSRIVARSGNNVAGHVWHPAPDGGATYAVNDGGWIYVSNSEVNFSGGGAGALRFDAQGTIVAAYPILTGTNRNCAGGPTPWSTWLSCEEVARGQVWECDPFGTQPAAVLPALGVFQHEAVAVDPERRHLYLTEDEEQGRFYRFTPSSWEDGARPDLSDGLLEVAQVADGIEGAVLWHPVPDPLFTGSTPTRFQIPQSTPFDGGEGCWYHAGIVYFTVKGDNSVWAYDAAAQQLMLLYAGSAGQNPLLSVVDNVTVSTGGDILVAEDGGDMQLVVLTRDGGTVPLLQVADHPRSEVTGPAFSPGGKRLYFSSQRGSAGLDEDGVTYEVIGPF